MLARTVWGHDYSETARVVSLESSCRDSRHGLRGARVGDWCHLGQAPLVPGLKHHVPIQLPKFVLNILCKNVLENSFAWIVIEDGLVGGMGAPEHLASLSAYCQLVYLPRGPL